MSNTPSEIESHRALHVEGTALLLVGAGGHARVVCEAALMAGHTVCVTETVGSDAAPTMLANIAYREWADAMAWASSSGARIHVAIGANGVRARETQRLMAYFGRNKLLTVCHPCASWSEHAAVDCGSFVAAQAVVGPCASVGVGCIINHSAVVDHDAQVGSFSHMAPGAVLGGGGRIGQRVLVGSRAVVLPGVCVCDDVILGAGTVVIHDIVESGTYVGVPARRMR